MLYLLHQISPLHLHQPNNYSSPQKHWDHKICKNIMISFSFSPNRTLLKLTFVHLLLRYCQDRRNLCRHRISQHHDDIHQHWILKSYRIAISVICIDYCFFACYFCSCLWLTTRVIMVFVLLTQEQRIFSRNILIFCAFEIVSVELVMSLLN